MITEPRIFTAFQLSSLLRNTVSPPAGALADLGASEHLSFPVSGRARLQAALLHSHPALQPEIFYPARRFDELMESIGTVRRTTESTSIRSILSKTFETLVAPLPQEIAAVSDRLSIAPTFADAFAARETALSTTAPQLLPSTSADQRLQQTAQHSVQPQRAHLLAPLLRFRYEAVPRPRPGAASPQPGKRQLLSSLSRAAAALVLALFGWKTERQSSPA